MPSRVNKKLVFHIAMGFILLIVIFTIPLIFSVSNYLSVTKRVNANLLIVEGWLPGNVISLAKEEFQNNSYDYIITTGVNSPEYFLLSQNGYLIFYPIIEITANKEQDYHLIEISAYSEMDGEDCAHFNVFINDSMITDFFADKRKRNYRIIWERTLKEIDSILVYFDNDKFVESVDRNLFVKEVIINHKLIIPYQQNSEFDIFLLDGKNRIRNNFNNYAELTRNGLLTLGVDSSDVMAVPGAKTKINRTLMSALAFRSWLDSSKIEVEGINILSQSFHSRRTWMTYKKILGESYKIGIVALPDSENKYLGNNKILMMLRETIGIVYYKLLLIFY